MMKMVFFSLFVLSSIVLFSQENSRIDKPSLMEKGFRKEVGIGIGYPFPVNDGATGKFGLSGELKISYSLNPRTDFIVGVEVNQLRQEKDTLIFTSSTACKDAKINSWYLTVPLLFSFNLIDNRNWSLFAGAYTGIRLSAKTSGIFYDPGDDSAPRYDMSKDAPLTKVDFGLDLGFAYRFVMMDKYYMTIKPRYRYGLIKLLENENEIYNRGFQLMLSVKL